MRLRRHFPPDADLPWRRPRHEVWLLALVALAALLPVTHESPQDVSRFCLSQALVHGRWLTVVTRLSASVVDVQRFALLRGALASSRNEASKGCDGEPPVQSILTLLGSTVFKPMPQSSPPSAVR